LYVDSGASNTEDENNSIVGLGFISNSAQQGNFFRIELNNNLLILSPAKKEPGAPVYGKYYLNRGYFYQGVSPI
jgi:hypothetical protein